MLTNYVAIVVRSMLRYKSFWFLNIFGLALGMTFSLFTLIWVTDEYSYDRFHRNADQLYRVTTDMNGQKSAWCSPPMVPAMKAALPEVVGAARLKTCQGLFEYGEKKIQEKNGYYADPDFLKMFDFPLSKGNPATALQQPDGILLTEEMARKYFGDADPIGKVLKMDQQHSLTVTGVLKDIPQHSHLRFDYLLPISFIMHTDRDLRENKWSSFTFKAYVQVRGDATPGAKGDYLAGVNRKITAIYKKIEPESPMSFVLQPLKEVHLYSSHSGDAEGQGDIKYVRIFSLIALFIIVIACINFTNLTTAYSLRRAKEIGLRKTLGADRAQLIRQFLGESLLTACLAMTVALILVCLLLPAFNALCGKQLSIDSLLTRNILLGLLAITVFTGLVSGSYPALYLSALQPVRILKGSAGSQQGSPLFRNVLVTLQFVVSICLIVGTSVIYTQLEYIRSKNLGFDRQNLLHIPVESSLMQNLQALKAELSTRSGIDNFTLVSELLTDLKSSTTELEWEGRNGKELPQVFNVSVDDRFIETFRMKMISGRGFSREFKADSNNYVVNEATVALMGIQPHEAVGKPFSYWGIRGTIIGVVKNFNFQPVHQRIEPLVLRLHTPSEGILVVRPKTGDPGRAIRDLEGVHQKVNAGGVFSFAFFDQDFANIYRTEQRLGALSRVFAGLAVFISCLGLFGLAAFTAQQRTKEIGIRKVLGASVDGVVLLLSKDFLKLVLLALLIALPLSWYIMDRWLAGYAFRVEIGFKVFLLTAVFTLLVAELTIIRQAVGAALKNPVKSLKSD